MVIGRFYLFENYLKKGIKKLRGNATYYFVAVGGQIPFQAKQKQRPTQRMGRLALTLPA